MRHLYRLRSLVLFLAALLCVMWTNPSVHTQAPAMLFGSYNGTATAVAVASDGSMKINFPAFPAGPYAVGDMLKATSTTAFGLLPDVAAGSYLRSGGIGAAPLWSTTTLPNAATLGAILYASATNVYANLDDVATGQVLASGGVGVAPAYTANPTVSTITANMPNIIVTSTDGVLIANDTAATAGVPVQISPRLRFRSNVWNTTAVAANNTDDWAFDSKPVSGLTPSGVLNLSTSLNGGAYTTRFAFSSAGLFNAVNITASSTLQSGGDIISAATGFIYFLTRAAFSSPANSQINFTNNAATVGVGIDVASDAVLKIRTRAQSGYASLDAGSRLLSGVLTISATAPTIASGGCTAPAVTNSNGTAAFKLTIGSSCAGVNTITLTLPAASNQWVVNCQDVTTPASFVIAEASSSTTAVVLNNYARTTGLAIDFVAAEVLLCSAIAG